MFAFATLILSSVTGHTVFAQSFANFESHQIHPLELSADSTRLFTVNTPENILTIYQITGSGLSVEAYVPVGLEPVTVRQRNANEVWVVNHLSDAISIVDLTTMNVKATLRTGDEPTDVVFAGTSGRAFVCASQEDRIEIYDPSNLSTAPVLVDLFASDPRALATNASGTKVYVAFFEGGNRTTILSEAEVASGGGLPAPNPPKDEGLPTAPETSLIVGWNGSNWVDDTGIKNWESFVSIPYSLPDNDIAELTADDAVPVPAYFSDVGTNNYNLTVNPVTGVAYVANIESFNLTRFEPNLKGQFARNQITLVDAQGGGLVTPVHLNSHINYAVSPGSPSEINMSLALPNGGDWDNSGTTLYLAATGSGKIAAINMAGNVINRADVGEGPTAVVVDNANDRIYVLNRFENTVSIVDKTAMTESGKVSLGYQVEPAAVTAGRTFLYNASITSAHGDLACATCHPFANLDNISWDLGDPTGMMQPAGQIGISDYHPMKGPMATQSLRGLASTQPFHWRGDRNDFVNFNPAFVGLLGAADTLSSSDMQAYTDFIMTVLYGPNPVQNLDRTYPDPAMPAGSPERGRIEFTTKPHVAGLQCQSCHNSAPAANDPFLVAPGMSSLIVPAGALQESQGMIVPQLRNLYEKTGFEDVAGPQKRGFGFTHDGNIDNLFTFLGFSGFQFANDQEKIDLEAFLLSFDTGTPPAVGAQQTVDATNKSATAVVARIDSLMNEADLSEIDLVVKGIVGGEHRGYVYAGGGFFESDRALDPPVTESDLRASAGTGKELTYTGVPLGSGMRIGVDRDEDGFRDRDEIDGGSDPADPLSTPLTATAIDPGNALGRSEVLFANRPNPIAPWGTEISFTLAEPKSATVKIYNLQGREVVVLMDKVRQQGTVTVRWDGRSSEGRSVASGLYIMRLEVGGVTKTKSVTVLR